MKNTLAICLSASMLAAALLLLTMVAGCATVIPQPIPPIVAGTIPTAAQDAAEVQATNTYRSGLTFADVAIDLGDPSAKAAADTLAAEGMADLSTYDTDYASGTPDTTGLLSVVQQIIAEIQALKSKVPTPQKAAAMAHATAIRAAKAK